MTTAPAIGTSHIQLPMSLEEVTPGWMTDALALSFPGIVVGSAQRETTRFGTSTSARFLLTYDRTAGHHDLPPSVYIKGGFDDIMRRRVWVALIMEARFYAELAADVPINIPKALFAGVDEEGHQGVVILEDLALRGVEVGHITAPRGVDTVAKLVELQAQQHAQFWGGSQLAAYSSWGEPQRAFLNYLLRQTSWDRVHQRKYANQIPAIFADRDSAVRALHKLWELDDVRVPTLLHGDPHSGNQFFEADGSPGYMDWQCPFPGAPGHDQAEMLTTSLTIEERRAHERDLITLYREVLVANGVSDAPSFDELFLSYRQNQMHAFTQAVFNPYDMQDEEVTHLSATRSLAAAVDLDMIGALGL